MNKINTSKFHKAWGKKKKNKSVSSSRGNVAGKTPYYPGSPSCDYNGMISSSRYYGLCGKYKLKLEICPAIFHVQLFL